VHIKTFQQNWENNRNAKVINQTKQDLKQHAQYGLQLMFSPQEMVYFDDF